MKKYTAVKDLEEISESALESSLAGFWDWDIVANKEYLSPRFKQMFGYADHEMENSPEAWQKIAFEEDTPLMFAAFEKHAQSNGVIPFHSVVRYHHKDGSTVWVRCNGKVVEWSIEGAPLRAIGCHVDITEEKEMEIRLKKALQEKDVLLAEVHHRVKNNLQLILSIARLKQKDDRIALHEIEDTINAIASAHEAIYRSERFDKIDLENYLNRILYPLIVEQRIQLDIKSVEINEQISFLLPIGLILIECSNNSIKHCFSSSTEPHIINILIEKNSNNNQIKITYKDNGSGYPPHVLKSTKNLKSFGLDLISALAEQLNGSVEFSNEKGAKMILLLSTDAEYI
jgi:PAS domain S-box-containing protein